MLHKPLPFVFLLLFSLFSSVAQAQYRAAVLPTNPVRGLEFYYFSSTADIEPAGLDTAQNFLVSGSIPNFLIGPRLSNDNFTFNYRGYIRVPADTIYTFFTGTDDGSNLYIDTTRVVANDGNHGERERSGTIRLRAGYHRIRVYFHDGTGNEVLNVSYSSGAISKRAIPDSVLFRDGSEFPTISAVRDTSMFEEDSITIAFKVKTTSAPSGNVLLSGRASNSASIAPSSIGFGGADSTRFVKIKTRRGVVGPVTIFLKAKLAGGVTTAKAFSILVKTRAPLVSAVRDTFIVLNNALNDVNFDVSDPDDGPVNLLITATSSVQTIVQNASITLAGTGTSRQLSLTPIANATGTTTISITASDPTGRVNTKTFDLIVGDTNTFRNPDAVGAIEPGLDYLLARADGGNTINFNTTLPDKAGTVENFNFEPARPNLDFFGMEYTGYIRVPRTAVYTFKTNSDDGSNLIIGTTRVVENDGSHGEQERLGQANLKAGLHKITVQYKNGNGGRSLSVRYAGGGVANQIIPQTILFRNAFAHPTIAASADTIRAVKNVTFLVPFIFRDSDGNEALGRGQTFSYTATIVPANRLQTIGTDSARTLAFSAIAPGIVRLKVVMTDAQGLKAIQFFDVKVRDTNLVSNDSRAKAAVVAYPNPTAGCIEVSNIKRSAQVTVTAVTGATYYKGNLGGLDMEAAKPGMYLLRINGTGQVIKLERD